MIPRNFSTNTEILTTLQKIVQIHHVGNFQIIAHIFYDVIKIAHYKLSPFVKTTL